MNGWRRLTAALGLGAVQSCAPASAPPEPRLEQAVIVHFNYGSTDLTQLFELEGKLAQALSAAGVGEYDGNEISADGSDDTLYMYGPDADRLFQTVEPLLKTTAFMKGAKVIVRYGPPADGVREREVTIAP